jgi:EAL domain-containing protein (putative c-di-GMP-specific phosphodiesterase class I)
MYRAKAAGRGSYLMYDSQMARDVEERVRIQGRLMRALQEDTLQLHYQPQIEATTGTVAGVEALLRWTDPELGTISPSVFVNVAEQCGLILPLGDWVLDRACRQFAQWREEGLVLRVSINVSAHQLKQLSFGEKLTQCLERWQVPAHMFELEITESSAMSSGEHTCRLLSDAVARGVSLALDDFGVGHSSLGQLRALPVTRLKLDRSLVNGVVEDERDAQMARAVVALAKGLGMMVVAEGVETEAQCSFLRQEGCHELQGWHFAPAVPPVEIPSLVKRLDQQHSQRCLCLKE